MPADPFQHLLDALAQALGLAPAPLQPDEHGVRGFTLHWEGRELAVVHVPPTGDGAPSWVSLAVEMAPPAPADEARVLGQLLDANFLMLAPGAPVFGRHAASGRILLRAGLPLAAASAEAVCQAAAHLALLADLWDQGQLFAPDGLTPRPATGGQSSAFA